VSASPDHGEHPVHPDPHVHEGGPVRGHAHHDHLAHHAAVSGAPSSSLSIALALTLAFCGVEAVVGWLYGSLALVADAGHMLSDAAALGLAMVAQRVARRERTHHRTWGFRRAEVLAAFVNGVALGVIAVWVLVEAVRRWASPPPLDGRAVLSTAVLGLLVNLAAAWVLSRGTSHNLNTRAALLHVIGDALGSVGAIVGALVVIFFGLRRADAAISVMISALLAYGAYHLVTKTTSVLMEGTPSAIDLRALEACVRETPGVLDTHDLHVWTISEGFDAVTVHVVLAHGFHGTDVAQDVARRIHERFHMDHVTVQPERKPPSLLPAERLHRKG
jgi:cobalt-zinc-cadmium efflux system protein